MHVIIHPPGAHRFKVPRISKIRLRILTHMSTNLASFASQVIRLELETQVSEGILVHMEKKNCIHFVRLVLPMRNRIVSERVRPKS